LSPKFYGPYEVIEKIEVVAYKLQLPLRTRIYNVFHVAFLKKFDSAPPASVPPLPPIVWGRDVPQPEQVVRARPTADSWESLLKWQDRVVGEASWEPLHQFKEAHPEFQLAGGNVVDSFFGQKYTRKKKESQAAQGPIGG
jgi:hypothetical protein